MKTHIEKSAISKEDSANVFSILSYTWLDSLFYTGYKRPLVASDITSAPKRLQAINATPKFEQSWLDELERVDKLLNDPKNQNPVSLRKSIWRVVRWELFAIGLIKIIGDTATILSPLVLIYLLEYVNQSKIENTSTATGFLFVGIFFLAMFIKSIAFNYFWQTGKFLSLIYPGQIIGLRAQNAMSFMIYKKALKLSAKSRQNFDGGKITNLISTDGQRIMLYFNLGNILFILITSQYSLDCADSNYLNYFFNGLGNYITFLNIL
jgi:ATP-binding cassette subfamily C (CFTR/MRP) protein 1